MFIVKAIEQPSKDTIMPFEIVDGIISFSRGVRRGDTVRKRNGAAKTLSFSKTFQSFLT